MHRPIASCVDSHFRVAITKNVISGQDNISLQQIWQIVYKKQEQRDHRTDPSGTLLEVGKDKDEQSWTRTLNEHFTRKD